MAIIKNDPVQLFLVYDNGKTLYFNITKLVSMEIRNEIMVDGPIKNFLDIRLEFDDSHEIEPIEQKKLLNN